MFTGYDYHDVELEIARADFMLNGKKGKTISIDECSFLSSVDIEELKLKRNFGIENRRNKRRIENTKARK